jgi:YD repeat-containing protein
MVYNMLLSQSLSYHFPHVADVTRTTTFGRMTVNGQYLSQITTRSGNTTINFINSSNARTDVPSETGSSSLYSLGEIIVLNRQGQKRRHVKQTYDPSAGRLTLKSIQELPVDGSAPRVKPPYEFTYNGSMPALGNSVASYAQDHWGYLNGNNKETLIPPYYIPLADGTPQYVDGANRSSNGIGPMMGVLTRIKYPTGGTTTFDYEPNSYSFVEQTPVMEYDTLTRSISVKHDGSMATDETTIPFTVGKVIDPQGIEFFIQMDYCSVDGGFGSDILGPHAVILDAAGHSVASWNFADSRFGYIRLEPGNYFLKATTKHKACPNSGHDYAYIQLTLRESDGLVQKRQNKTAGGVRIKKITDYDGLNTSNNIIRRYEYKMPENGTYVSSGVIAHNPKYEYDTYMQDPNYGIVSYKVHVSNSVIAMGFTQSAPVSYRQVTVLYGENGEFGKSESYFTSFYDANDDYTHNEEPPFPPTVKYDYKRGLLQKQIDYKWENAQYKPVRQIENTYKSQRSTVPGLKVEKRCPSCTGWNAAYRVAENFFALGPHAFNFGITKLETSKETLFDNTGSFTTKERYEYDPALHFLQKEVVKTSDGKEIITGYSYPFNYTSRTYALDQMMSKHILSPVIEKLVTEKAADGSEKVIDASFTQYNVMADGKVLPLQALSLAADVPASIHRSVDHGGNFDDQKYISQVVYNKYTSFGKPEQFTTRGDIISSYIWGYSGTQLLAKITNAAVDVCAFTSFEDGDYVTGNWQAAASSQFSNDAHTGIRSISGQITTLKALLPGQYVLSYWAKAPADGVSITVNGVTKAIGKSWKRYEWVLTDPGSVTIVTNGNLIDDLRLHPAGAQMKTFTYDPIVGVTSVTDENHTTVYYEYDNYNRLKNIKDSDGNILKNYQYNYKN